MRQVPEEASGGCAREGTRQKPDEPGEAEEDGQEEMRVTTAGKNRFAIYDPKTVLFGALLILSGCTREEATASLRGDLQVDEFEIVHARFPCRSPDMHFFGYRFRIGLKGEYAFGDICWDASAQKWTWQILPNYPLSRLNIRK
jgi:hypothetical protein